MFRTSACFPDLDKAQNGLHPASVGVFQGLIFSCPEPGQRVEDWLGSIADVAWPHDPDDAGLSEFPDSVVYDMACNWKVFYENAIDGYHLAYLHEHTLGGPVPSQNLWDRHGDHLVWYSTENSGHRSRVPNHLNEQAEAWGSRKIPAAATHGYGGVYMLFPATLVVATPWSLSISVLEPVAAGRTLMHVRSWQPKSLFGSEGRAKDIPGYDAATGRITSSNWTQHPLETGDFQTEDVYVVEKMQRALQSPRHSVGALAQGAGAELPITWFQSTVLRHMGKAATE